MYDSASIPLTDGIVVGAEPERGNDFRPPSGDYSLCDLIRLLFGRLLRCSRSGIGSAWATTRRDNASALSPMSKMHQSAKRRTARSAICRSAFS